MVINKLLDSLGGTNFEDRSDKTHISEEESATWQAILDNAVGTSAELACKGQKVTGWENLDNTAAELYSEEFGLQGTVNTDETTAAFNSTRYELKSSFDISKAKLDGEFYDFSRQDKLPKGFAFNSDGTKVYMLGVYTNNYIFQYSLSTAYELSTATYELKSFSVNSQDDTPNNIFFSSDETKMYMVGEDNNTIYQYTLSTAGDISTASYASKSYLVTQDTNIDDIFIKSDGLILYVLGDGNNFVYQYTLGTAWDISTATYASKSKDVSAQDTFLKGLFFSSDGTKMYIAGTQNDSIFQYTLSTAWDVSTATYASKNFDPSSQDNTPTGVIFNDDGTKMYIIGFNTHYGFEYTLSTAWDVSTASYITKEISITTQDTSPRGMFFNPDGTILYVSGTQNDSIYQYTLSTAYDISTAVYASKSFDFSGIITDINGFFIKPEGDKIYIVGKTNQEICQYTLSTVWDISTAVYTSKSFDTSTVSGSGPTGIFFKEDGLKIYYCSSSYVIQLNLSTAWDISTATYSSIFLNISQDASILEGLFFSLDGTKLFLTANFSTTGFEAHYIYRYTLSTAWDISTGTYDNISFDLETQDSFPSGLFINSDGSKMYIVGNINDKIYQYDLQSSSVFSDYGTLPIDEDTNSFCLYWYGPLESDTEAFFILSDGTNETIYPVDRLTKRTQALKIGDLETITYVKIKSFFASLTTSTENAFGWGLVKIN